MTSNKELWKNSQLLYNSDIHFAVFSVEIQIELGSKIRVWFEIPKITDIKFVFDLITPIDYKRLMLS